MRTRDWADNSLGEVHAHETQRTPRAATHTHAAPFLPAACATGNYCITAAADHIRRGEADIMLAGALGWGLSCSASSRCQKAVG